MSPNSKMPDSDALSALGADRKQGRATTPDAAPRAAQGFGDTAQWGWWPSEPTCTAHPVAYPQGRRGQSAVPTTALCPDALRLQPPCTLCRFAACGMAPGTNRLRPAVASRQGLA